MTPENLKEIGGIRFSILSPSEVRKYSVTEITAPETYDEDGLPVQGGLMDNRLGTLEPGQKCATCGNTALRCPGHFGHIELAEPVLHIAFAEEVNKLLHSFCRVCGRFKMLTEDVETYKTKIKEESKFNPKVRDKIAKQLFMKTKKIMLCPHCGTEQYKVEFLKPTIFHEITESGGATRLLPNAIRERLERITDDDMSLINYNPKSVRPEWFVLQVLGVPPVVVRPSITLETGIRSEDDLTHKIVDILRVNQRVRESKESGTPPLIVQDLVDLLQYHVTTFFDNEVSGIPQSHHRSGRPLKTISQRLKGKEGRFRGSLSGKRVDFSARTVISPDPSLDISEVGVPVAVAKKLSIPEKYSKLNAKFLNELVLNGSDVHPGANYVIRPDGVKIRLDYVEDKQALVDSLEDGFVIERHLIDGDIVIFNRQPSLHRMSVMGHSIRVLPYRTFRLHPAVCPPYNADFDGDEMNLHVPQSTEARAEALTLMMVHDQIVSPRYGGPIIGGTRDYISAGYLLTHDDTLLEVDEFSDLALTGGYIGPLPKPVKSNPPLYTGKQLFSLFLPDDFNYKLSSKWARAKNLSNDVLIKDGQLITGLIDRAAIGSEEPDSILHRISKDYGSEEARKFLNSALSVLRSYISNRGFSLSYKELTLDKSAEKKVFKSISNSYVNVDALITKSKNGELVGARGMSEAETLEAHIVHELSKARDKAGRVSDTALFDDNSGVIMARTGARGSSLNLGQMTAALGQQSVRGKRIQNGFNQRALSHFKKGDMSPDAKGFVKSNYRTGLSPTEFFFHAMGGREGLVDTAVRTQQSGYMQRRLINALEHIRVEYDRTVRDPHGNIIQFLYGEDGIDPAKSDHGDAVNISRQVDISMIDNTSKSKSDPKKIDSILKPYKSKFNEKVFEDLKDSFSNNFITESGMKSVAKRTLELTNKALVEPGEASGIVAAQSIGEPGTQMTLRTFHFAGVQEKDVTLGLPRLIELVDARKIPSKPSMDIYLKAAHSKTSEKAREIGKKILYTTVMDLVSQTEVDYIEGIKLKFQSDTLNDFGITLDKIGEVVELGSKREVKVDHRNTSVMVIVEDTDASTLFSLRNKLLGLRIAGIKDIKNLTIVKKDSEWMIQTSGSNLGKVFKIPGVDTSRTTTNNIWEIAAVVGIEAARSTLINEITHTLDEQGLEVDIRHIVLVSDLMSSTGVLKSIGRHGIAGTKESVLARAAFEITVPTISKASVTGEIEELKGVTENVIVGLPVPVGTGMIELYMKR
ncbi:MAG: DNA-directed RNA polymerase subunit A' [Thaumarchaeota archaeon]|nr:DNA-directed RNA polymerase subunit A' [Nitrososphaerota archaeon]